MPAGQCGRCGSRQAFGVLGRLRANRLNERRVVRLVVVEIHVVLDGGDDDVDGVGTGSPRINGEKLNCSTREDRCAALSSADTAMVGVTGAGSRSRDVKERIVIEPAAGPVIQAHGSMDLLDGAIRDLDQALDFTTGVSTSSHTVVVIDGFEKPEVPVALGRYLVGALAGAVDIDAQLCEILLARGVNSADELRNTVIGLISETNEFKTDVETKFRDSRRNAWIGEGIGHAMLAVTARRETSSVDGLIRTLSGVHQSPTRQGLDLVGTYVRNGLLEVAIGESKTTYSNGSKHLRDAAILFAEVDEGVYGPDLRMALASFRRALPAALASQVSDALWRTNGCYLPIVVHQAEFDVMRHRSYLAGLRPPLERRRVIIIRFEAFHLFFDAVADAMRAAVDELVF